MLVPGERQRWRATGKYRSPGSSELTDGCELVEVEFDAVTVNPPSVKFPASGLTTCEPSGGLLSLDFFTVTSSSGP